MKITDTHVYFWDGIYSNFYPVTFLYKNKIFVNSEQAFMWEKAIAFNDHEMTYKIMNSNNPSDAKKFGRKVKNFNDKEWDKVKEQIMFDVVFAKFNSNILLKKELISTNNKIIVEASPFDKIWGVGLDQNNPDILDENKWKGQNLLGKVLMNVRNKLK